MATAIKTREVLSQLDKVTRVLAYGHNGKALVFVFDKDAITKEKVKTALEQTKELKLRRMSRA
jgi:hypothetical protein